MTEKEKMLAGKLYAPDDPELEQIRARAHRLCHQINLLPPDDPQRAELIAELLPQCSASASLEGPIYFDYGLFTSIGENVFANFNFTVLDVAPVTIGDNILFGPNVSLLTPAHPLLPEERNPYQRPDGSWTNQEYASPITIGSNCWIGGSVTICGGVTIGEGAVIGAGSVVTRDIPAGYVAVGSPCRPLRKITEADSVKNHPELF